MIPFILLTVLGAARAEPPSPSPAAAAPAIESHAAAAQTTHVRASLTLRVSDREAASKAAIAAANAHGGWFASLDTAQVSLRVPVDAVDSTLETLHALGDVVARDYTATDQSAELIELAGRLKSRQDVLDQYMAVLETASPKAIVTVEREVTRAVAEIEQIQGRLKLLRHQARIAHITVEFRYQERSAPSRDGTSSFAWLNTVNVADILTDFQIGLRARPAKVAAHAPDGFAPWKRTRRFQAVSPDDVVYRVRSAPNRPRADLAFWKEALTSRMTDAGYHLIDTAEITDAAGHPGAQVEFGAANGEQDQSYIVAIFVHGRHITIAEATGEATVFKGRRDAVVAAISQLDG